MNKPVAFFVGLFISSFLVVIGALVCRARHSLDFGELYFLASAGASAAGIATAQRQHRYDSMSPRALFMLPFFLLFTSPLWLAVQAIVSGWKEDAPSLRWTGIALAFVASVVSLLIFFCVSGLDEKKPSKSPKPTSDGTDHR
jgi:hypothetical protein